MQAETTPATTSYEKWRGRAEQLAEDAAAEIRADGSIDDALGHLSAADAALRIALGELPEEELLSWFPEDDDESDCTCTPEQREGGGFRGSCPVHGSRGRHRA